MATTDSVTVSSSTGLDGNTYTNSVSNDTLTNEDFITLMIQELKLQDPTSPTDSSQMLSTQMQMSTISTNQEMVAAMEALQTSFTQSALSSAANVIGQNIEDGNIGEDGINKAYTVTSVESVDGEVQVRAQRILYIENKVSYTDPSDDSVSYIDYDTNGNITDANGNNTGYKVALNDPGDPIVDTNGELVILDENNEAVSDHGYSLSGTSGVVYSNESTNIPFSTITKIF